MDHPARLHLAGTRGHRAARGAAVGELLPGFRFQRWSRGTVDGAVYSAAPGQLGIGSIDHRIDVQGGDVGADHPDVRGAMGITGTVPGCHFE